MSANREGGQGTQKSGQKPIPENEPNTPTPDQQRDPGQGRQEGQNRPTGGKEDR